MAKSIAAVASHISLYVSIITCDEILARSIPVVISTIVTTSLIKHHIIYSSSVIVTLSNDWPPLIENNFIFQCGCSWLPVISNKVVILQCRPQAFVTFTVWSLYEKHCADAFHRIV